MVEINISAEELRKRSLFVAVPMYGGQCCGIFTQSMVHLTSLCHNYGIQMKTFFLFNESLIPRARAYCADEFMRSGMTHLMFIDSDIGFDPNDVLTLLALQSEDSPYDVIAGPYPKKCISWEKIVHAVNKGAADKDPRELEKYVGDYVFNLAGGQTTFNLGQPVSVLEAGTGFMMIRKSTFEKYQEAYPQYWYKPDHVRTENFDGSREIMMYFNCEIDPETKRYLSEDYLFCQNVRKMGGEVYLCPWMQLKHMGSYIFGGSLPDVLMIGASATADPSAIKPKSLQPNIDQKTPLAVLNTNKPSAIKAPKLSK